MRSAPLVFIHRRGIMHSKIDFDWFEESITLTRRSNPNSEIILVADESYSYLAKKIQGKFFLLDDIISNDVKVSRFSDMYTHFSVNPVDYEMFCFQRWLILDSIREILALDHIIYVDSDNVFLSQIGDIISPYDDADILTHVDSLSAWFVGFSAELLNSYVDYLLRLYSLSADTLINCIMYLSRRYNTLSIGHERGLGNNFPHFSDMYSLQSFQEYVFILHDEASPDALRALTTPINHVHNTIPAFSMHPIPQYNNFNAYTIHDFPVRIDESSMRLQIYVEENQKPKWHVKGNEAPGSLWYNINNLHMQGDNKWYIRNLSTVLGRLGDNGKEVKSFIDFLRS